MYQANPESKGTIHRLTKIVIDADTETWVGSRKLKPVRQELGEAFSGFGLQVTHRWFTVLRQMMVFHAEGEVPCEEGCLFLPENLKYPELKLLLLVPWKSLWAAPRLSSGGTAHFLILQLQFRPTILFQP